MEQKQVPGCYAHAAIAANAVATSVGSAVFSTAVLLASLTMGAATTWLAAGQLGGYEGILASSLQTASAMGNDSVVAVICLQLQLLFTFVPGVAVAGAAHRGLTSAGRFLWTVTSRSCK